MELSGDKYLSYLSYDGVIVVTSDYAQALSHAQSLALSGNPADIVAMESNESRGDQLDGAARDFALTHGLFPYSLDTTQVIRYSSTDPWYARGAVEVNLPPSRWVINRPS